MTVQIRKAEIQDAPAIANVTQSIGWFAALKDLSLEQATAQITRQLALCHADDSHAVYIAELESVVVGYAAVHWLPYLIFSGPEGFISELFVMETARGHGVGTQLLATIEQEARIRGCSRLGLLNSRIRESYQRGFYKKHGWVERDEVASFTFKLLP